MLLSFVIVFRESLEAAIIIGIVLSILDKTNQNNIRWVVWVSILLAIIGSILGKIAFDQLVGGFKGVYEETFEGIVMIIGAFFVVTIIIWGTKHQNTTTVISKKETLSSISIFILVFFSVLREGIETVIFFAATQIEENYLALFGSILGVTLAIAITYLIFKGFKLFSFKLFFNITNIMLIFIASGLLAHGIHELQEAKLIPVIYEHIFDINPLQNADGTYPMLHEEGIVGSFLKAIFGYNGNPNLIELLAWIVSIVLLFYITFSPKKIIKKT